MNVSEQFFERHRAVLDGALKAIATRGYWSAYPEVPSGKFYGETAKEDGAAAFAAALKRKKFAIDQPGTGRWVGDEQSPYGLKLGVKYPKVDLDALLAAAGLAMKGWSEASVEERTGVCLEILHRLNRRSFEIASAVMHTTGQGFMMAFQAGGPHAQDRGLEAVAYAWQAMTSTPTHARWQKQVSKTETVTLEKRYRIVPRGVSVVIGCSTFPTWNSYPAIFASLVTGNAVVVKPHPGAVLPLAMTVETARAVLTEAGFDPNVITLAADSSKGPIAKKLVMRDEVKLIDYTGGSAFGEWIEKKATHATVFTEKAGVNSVVIDSCDDLRAMTGNLAFTLSLYSGQMCTTSQNIFVPKGGIKVGGEHKSFDEVAQAIVGAVNWFLSEPARATEVLGAIQNEATAKRVKEAESEAIMAGAKVLRASEAVSNERFPEARVISPLIVQTEASHEKLFMREMFGPIAYIVAVESAEQGIALAAKAAKELGAITMAVYSTDDAVLAKAEEAAVEAGVPLSCNLTGQIYVNQSAAFSDFHVSGCNPSGNATLCDPAFVAGRFRVVQSRVPVKVEAAVAVSS